MFCVCVREREDEKEEIIPMHKQRPGDMQL